MVLTGQGGLVHGCVADEPVNAGERVT
jgi:hypothetical protein